MSINIQIQKKDLCLLSAIIIFLIGVGFVIAYNSGGPPSLMGHSSEELEIDINGDNIADKTLQQAINDGNFGGGGSVTCQSFAGAAPVGDLCPDCYFENRNDMDAYGNRFLISSDVASTVHRCIELGYDWGYATSTYNVGEWCGTYVNARTKKWVGSWITGGVGFIPLNCEHYAVKSAECCTFN